MKRVLFHPLARRELLEAEVFYDARAAGLGASFSVAVEGAITVVKRFPKLGHPLPDGLRRKVVQGFPYDLVYRVEGEVLRILAVAHHRRRPSDWTDRRT